MNVLQSTAASAERVFELLDEAEEEPDAAAPVVLEHTQRPHQRSRTCRSATCADTPLIEDLTLDVRPGQTVAIVGPTGAGKTTLVNLLLRFYEIDHGRITVDGVDTHEMTRSDLRRLFGMVLQDAWLFTGTIRDNIAYGREGATEDEILAAAQRGPRRPLRAHPARRLRHRARRRRHHRLAGREAAAHHRPGLPGRPGHPHPRRGHELGRHAHRGADPGGDGRAHEGPHELRHRPPPLDHPRRRHDPRHGPRPHHRAGHARGAPGARAASTTTSTPASSRRRSTRPRRTGLRV